MDAGARAVQNRVSAVPERVPAAGRHVDGHLLGHRRRRSADPAAGRRLRHRIRAPGDHLRREPRTWIPASAARLEPAARVVAVPEARTGSYVGDLADARHPDDRGPADYLRPMADAWAPALDGTYLRRRGPVRTCRP